MCILCEIRNNNYMSLSELPNFNGFQSSWLLASLVAVGVHNCFLLFQRQFSTEFGLLFPEWMLFSARVGIKRNVTPSLVS